MNKRGTRALTLNMNNPNFKFLPKSKRSQVTIFIIIAVLVVAGVVLFFTLKGNIKKQETYPPEVAPIVNFVEECIEEAGESAVYDLALKGGYNEPEETTDNGITYYLYKNKSYLPSKEQLESEFSTYVNRKYFLCSRHFINFTDYEVEEGNFETTTKIYPNKIVLNVEYPLTIKKRGFESTSITKREYKIEILTRFGLVYESILKFITENLNFKGVCVTCLSNAVKEKDLYVNIYSEDGNTIFIFRDEKSKLNEKPFEWVFANEY